MKNTSLRVALFVFLVTQTACLEMLSGLVGSSSSTTMLGSNSSDDSNQIVSSGAIDSTSDTQSGESDFSDSDTVGVDIGPGIAKLERGSIDATEIAGTVTMSTSDTGDVAVTGKPGATASTGTSVEQVTILGEAGAVSGTCPDSEGECVADLVVRDSETGEIVKRGVSNPDGSFRLNLPKRFSSRILELSVEGVSGEESKPLYLTVFSSDHYSVGLDRLPANSSDLAMADGKLVFNVKNRFDADINNIAVMNQSGGTLDILAEDVEEVSHINLYSPREVFRMDYESYILANTGDYNTIIHIEGDEELTVLDDFPNGTYDPVLGYRKDYSDISFAAQGRGEFAAKYGFEQDHQVNYITLIPAVESDIPNDIYIRAGVTNNIINRSLTFRGRSALVVMDRLHTGKYIARVLNVEAITSLGISELAAFKSQNPGIVNVPSILLFQTNDAVRNPVVSHSLDGENPFMVFECQYGVTASWHVCINYYDEEIIPLTSELSGRPYGASNLTVNLNDQFVAASIYMPDTEESHILVVHVPSGDVIKVTKPVGGTQIRYGKTTFSDVSPNVLSYVSLLPNGELSPSVINLRLHPGTGRYISDSPYCDPDLVTCD